MYEFLLCLTPRLSSRVAVLEAKVWEEEYDLNAVRLCFQATITLTTGELYSLEPVVSQPIYDNSESAENQTQTTRVCKLACVYATHMQNV